MTAAAAAAPPAPAGAAGEPAAASDSSAVCGPPYADPASLDAHVERSWAFFRSLGSPKWHVAPMVDQSELPFRMLCRRHGAEAAYTPMLHSRLFLESPAYREEHFTTCEGDRPLFAQFCANDPDTFVGAASFVQDQVDYVDVNLGCPQRIAKRGNYGAFLMDDLPAVRALVVAGARRLRAPVSCKIRLFPDLGRTVEYARMLQEAGCSLLAVHGRTREMKDLSANRANWDAIAAVRAAVRIPVLANGDVRCLADAAALMEHTGADGVLSAEPLLFNPALFSPERSPTEPAVCPLEAYRLCEQYLDLAVQHPAHMRMVKGHVHKLLQGWLGEFTDIRDRLSREANALQARGVRALVAEMGELIRATGRGHPVPRVPERKLRAIEREAARQAAIEEQQREAAALAALGGGGGDDAAAAADGSAGAGSGAQHQPEQQQQQQQQPQQQPEPEQPEQQQLEQLAGQRAADLEPPRKVRPSGDAAGVGGVRAINWLQPAPPQQHSGSASSERGGGGAPADADAC